MKKLVLVLAGGLLLGSCTTEVTETTLTEPGTEEAAQGNDVIDAGNVISKAVNKDIAEGDVITLEGWYLGLLGSMDSDDKTLHLGVKGSNNAPVQATMAPGQEAKLEGVGFDKQITIKGEFTGLSNFDTKINIKDCMVIEVK